MTFYYTEKSTLTLLKIVKEAVVRTGNSVLIAIRIRMKHDVISIYVSIDYYVLIYMYTCDIFLHRAC